MQVITLEELLEGWRAIYCVTVGQESEGAIIKFVTGMRNHVQFHSRIPVGLIRCCEFFPQSFPPYGQD